MYVFQMNDGNFHIATYTRTQFDKPAAWTKIVAHPLYGKAFGTRSAAETAREQIWREVTA